MKSELFSDISIVASFCNVIDHCLINEVSTLPPYRLHVNSEFSPSRANRVPGVTTRAIE